jgi:hypothetical protein
MDDGEPDVIDELDRIASELQMTSTELRRLVEVERRRIERLYGEGDHGPA